MTSPPESDDLSQLYEELRRFAPSNAADEMTQLAQRLTEIRNQEPAQGQEQDQLTEVWSRVEHYLSEHPRAIDSGEDGDLGG